MAVQENPHSAGRESIADHQPRLHSMDEVCRLVGGMGSTWFYAEVAAKRILASPMVPSMNRLAQLCPRRLISVLQTLGRHANIGSTPSDRVEAAE
jgi:hypothetical protein